jgi:DNA repair exonuclease SbcCD ATPase subunit
METSILLFEDNRGIYIPQNFAEEIIHELFTGYTKEDIAELLKGPYYEFYWEVWDKVLQNAEHKDKDGNKWALEQDGDVWLVCPYLQKKEELETKKNELADKKEQLDSLEDEIEKLEDEIEDLESDIENMEEGEEK